VLAAAFGVIASQLPLDLRGHGLANLTRASVALLAGAGLYACARSRRLRQHKTTMLLVLAPMALAAYVNFGTFHGFRTHVQFHDVAHYYLGAKYSAELGHADLYVAMLAAQHETGKAKLPAQVRDLRDYRVVPTPELLIERAADVKEAFTPDRWNAFKRDVDLFRQGLQTQFGRVMLDHGFNGTPVWLLLAEPISQLAPAGDYTALRILTALDGALIALALGAVLWAFGLNTALLVLLGYCVTFGAGFGWTGGSFLRQPWLASILLALCCLKKDRHGAAGALLALATLLRVFPAALMFPIVARGLVTGYRRGQVPSNTIRLLGGFTVASVVLVMATALLPKGFFHWVDFIDTMNVHRSSLSASRIGLLEVLGYHGHELQIGFDERQALIDRRSLIETGQRLLVLLPLAVYTVRLAPRLSPVAATALGLPLIYAGITLASYYYAVLVVYLIAMRRRGVELSVFFALQGVALLLDHFETRPILPYVYGSALLLLLWVVLYRSVPRRAFAARARRQQTPAT
jgi:hypothetical protein